MTETQLDRRRRLNRESQRRNRAIHKAGWQRYVIYAPESALESHLKTIGVVDVHEELSHEELEGVLQGVINEWVGE